MALYSQVYIQVNGMTLAENQTIETALEGDIPDVMTIVKNWAGITPAPIVRTITAANVIPLPGVEFPFEEKMLAFEEVEIQLQEEGSGMKCVSRGYIVNVPRSAGVGQNTTISFTFRGTPSAFA
jgi:hypothetical protein